MNQRFTFNAYVLSVIDPKRICVRVEKEHLEVVTKRLTAANDKTTFKDTIVVGVNDCGFNIDFDWKELIDLVGVQISINAITRRYSYYKTSTAYDEDNNIRKWHVHCKGVSVVAKTITNMKD